MPNRVETEPLSMLFSLATPAPSGERIQAYVAQACVLDFALLFGLTWFGEVSSWSQLAQSIRIQIVLPIFEMYNPILYIRS